MAFFVPVVRNGKWDIYPTRVRTTSTGSNSSGSRTSSESEKSSGGNSLSTSPAAAQSGVEANRKVRFSRSMSQDGGVTMAMYRNRSLRASSDCGPTLTLSPTLATANVMPRSGSLRGLRSTGQLGIKNKSNCAPTSATKMCASTPPPNTTTTQLTGSRNSVSKFHSKLVDKIKRKFRIKGDDSEAVSGDEDGMVRAST